MDCPRRAEFLFWEPVRQYWILVMAGGDHAAYYESFDVYVGERERLDHVPTIGADRLRDGGTTMVDTDLGYVWWPSLWRQDRVVTWCGLPVREMARWDSSRPDDGCRVEEIRGRGARLLDPPAV